MVLLGLSIIFQKCFYNELLEKFVGDKIKMKANNQKAKIELKKLKGLKETSKIKNQNN